MSTKARRLVVAGVVFGMLLALAPPRAEAAWNSRAGDLPGIASGKSVAIMAAAAGAGVLTLYLIKRSKSKAKTADPAAADPGNARKAADPFAPAPDLALHGDGLPVGVSTAVLVRRLRADPRFGRLFQRGARSSLAGVEVAAAE